MRVRRLVLACLPAFLLLPALAAPDSASAARLVVGMGDQKHQMFSDPRFAALGLKKARIVVPYDTIDNQDWELGVTDNWLAAAQAAGVEPLVTFSHSWRTPKHLPSVRQFRRIFRQFRARYPHVRVYTPWNEANHSSQPTARSPRRAAQYYNEVRRYCRGCRIVAADVLDQRNLAKWIRTFRRYAKGKPRLWGLHNYVDANRRVPLKRSSTAKFLNLVPGEVWLTEAGGIVQFLSYKYDERRAARATARTFQLARMSKRIKRLYLYHWQADAIENPRWDSGLLNADGSPRLGFRELVRQLTRINGGRLPGNPWIY